MSNYVFLLLFVNYGMFEVKMFVRLKSENENSGVIQIYNNNKNKSE